VSSITKETPLPVRENERPSADRAAATRVSRVGRTRLSLVTPAYNERANLPVLYQRLCQVLDPADLDWEWIIVDDHSTDDTFRVVSELAERDERVRGLRLARNGGSHLALACGLRYALGDCAVVLAADLQDPPETIPDLLERWRLGARIVWAARAHRTDVRWTTRYSSRFYWAIMGRLPGMKDFPRAGADFFLVDRAVLDAFARFRETNTSVIHLIAWLGFRQDTVTYAKQPRLHGESGWNLARKVKTAIDPITAFSDLPIRAIWLAGLLSAMAGVVAAGRSAFRFLTGSEESPGATAVIAVLLLGFGLRLAALGALGEYLWRVLDEVRARPRDSIEAAVGSPRVPGGAGR